MGSGLSLREPRNEGRAILFSSGVAPAVQFGQSGTT